MASPALAKDLPDFADIVERESPSVVNISSVQSSAPVIPGLDPNDPFFDLLKQQLAPGAEERTSLGSGFIIANDGFVLTSAHVVAGARKIVVSLSNHQQYLASVVGVDRRSDVALLHIPVQGLRSAHIGNPEELRVGEWVLAIGSPFGFEYSATAGIVSGTHRWLPDEEYVPFIQTDVAINPGNSGGPLFNQRGEVIGINAQIYSRTGGFMGLSFAVPIDLAMRVVGDLRRTGRARYGWLGVVLRDLSPEGRKLWGEGAVVANVRQGGPAEKGGLLPGDIVLRFGKLPLRNASDFARAINASEPGKAVDTDVLRNSRHLILRLVPSEAPLR